jgi:anti-anti-sigma regulatory factor
VADIGSPPEIRTVIKIDPATEFAIVSCCGRLVASHRDEFYEDVRKLIPGSKRIVLDFSEVTNMDSSGPGTVIRLYVSAKSAGCDATCSL